MDYILAPSILSADFKILGEQMKITEDNGAKYLHFDVMDGMFVPSISFGNAGIKIYPQCNRPGYGCTSYGAGTNSLCGGF